MAVGFSSANTTADVVISSSQGARVMGWHANEDATTAAVAEFVIRNGSSTAGDPVIPVNLAANGSDHEWFGPMGVVFSQGVFLDRLSGTTTVTVFIE